MKKWLFCTIWILLLATAVQAQKTCTRVSPGSQNCIATISWIASAVDAMHDAPTDYIIRRGDAGGAMTEIGKVAATTTSFQNTFTDTGNTAHCWDAVASNASGSSAPSNQSCWTTPTINAAPPNTPGGVTIAAISSQTLRVSWADNNDPPDNETATEIQGKRATGQPYSLIATVGPDVTTWDWTGRLSYKTYCTRVRAMNGDTASAYTQASCATTSKK